jgi:hypothetical protein
MRGYSTSVFDNAPDGFEYTNHPQNKLRKGWLRYCEDATSYRQLTGDLSGADAEHALLRVLSEWATTLDPATVKAAELPTLER